MGVGTATTTKSASRSRAASVVGSNSFAAANSSWLNFAGRIDGDPIGIDLGGRYIEADGSIFLAELDRQRKADISQTDDGHDAISYH